MYSIYIVWNEIGYNRDCISFTITSSSKLLQIVINKIAAETRTPTGVLHLFDIQTQPAACSLLSVIKWESVDMIVGCVGCREMIYHQRIATPKSKMSLMQANNLIFKCATKIIKMIKSRKHVMYARYCNSVKILMNGYWTASFATHSHTLLIIITIKLTLINLHKTMPVFGLVFVGRDNASINKISTQKIMYICVQWHLCYMHSNVYIVVAGSVEMCLLHTLCMLKCDKVHPRVPIIETLNYFHSTWEYSQWKWLLKFSVAPRKRHATVQEKTNSCT